MKTAYPIILTPAETGYVVTVPDLQINTEGADIADAIDMAADAIGLWGITAQDMGKVVPAPSSALPRAMTGSLPHSPLLTSTHTAGRMTCEPFGKMSRFHAI